MTGVTGADDGEGPVTFAAFAAMIGKSRPYVSKQKALGVLHGPAFSADGRIFPEIARQQLAEAADPARSAGGVSRPNSESTYAAQRARKISAEAERAEIELRVRKGELVARSRIEEVFMPLLRELRDALLDAPRDEMLDAAAEHRVRAALTRILEEFSSRAARVAAEISDGGAAPAA